MRSNNKIDSSLLSELLAARIRRSVQDSSKVKQAEHEDRQDLKQTSENSEEGKSKRQRSDQELGHTVVEAQKGRSLGSKAPEDEPRIKFSERRTKEPEIRGSEKESCPKSDGLILSSPIKTSKGHAMFIQPSADCGQGCSDQRHVRPRSSSLFKIAQPDAALIEDGGQDPTAKAHKSSSNSSEYDETLIASPSKQRASPKSYNRRQSLDYAAAKGRQASHSGSLTTRAHRHEFPSSQTLRDSDMEARPEKIMLSIERSQRRTSDTKRAMQLATDAVDKLEQAGRLLSGRSQGQVVDTENLVQAVTVPTLEHVAQSSDINSETTSNLISESMTRRILSSAQTSPYGPASDTIAPDTLVPAQDESNGMLDYHNQNLLRPSRFSTFTIKPVDPPYTNNPGRGLESRGELEIDGSQTLVDMYIDKSPFVEKRFNSATDVEQSQGSFHLSDASKGSFLTNDLQSLLVVGKPVRLKPHAAKQSKQFEPPSSIKQMISYLVDRGAENQTRLLLGRRTFSDPLLALKQTLKQSYEEDGQVNPPSLPSARPPGHEANMAIEPYSLQSWCQHFHWRYVEQEEILCQTLQADPGLKVYRRPISWCPDGEKDEESARFLYGLRSGAVWLLKGQSSNHGLPEVRYDSRWNRLLVLPHSISLFDVRSQSSHPDYLPPTKLRQRQAIQLCGFEIWRHDRNTFRCMLRSCRKLIMDFETATHICDGCGPKTEIRYCSLQHLLEDIPEHWEECGVS